jgi:predicted hydrocarbon binding protein
MSQGKNRSEYPGSVRANQGRLEDFFTLDFRTGSIVNQMTEERVHVIPTLDWRRLREDLASEFQGKEASFILSRVSSIMGATIAREMMKFLSEPASLVNNIADLSAAAGWGVISMTGDIQYGGAFEVTVTNCVFCDKEELAHSPQCDFLVGAIKGMADSIYGTPHRVSEETCAAMGHSFCRFKVEEFDDPALLSGPRNPKHREPSELSLDR